MKFFKLNLETRQVGTQDHKVNIQQINPISVTSSSMSDLINTIISFTLVSLLILAVILLSVRVYQHHIILLTLVRPVEAYVLTRPTLPSTTEPAQVDPTVPLSDIVILFILAIVVVLCCECSHCLSGE